VKGLGLAQRDGQLLRAVAQPDVGGTSQSSSPRADSAFFRPTPRIGRERDVAQIERQRHRRRPRQRGLDEAIGFNRTMNGFEIHAGGRKVAARRHYVRATRHLW
jgi:hypothetical protein